LFWRRKSNEPQDEQPTEEGSVWHDVESASEPALAQKPAAEPTAPETVAAEPIAPEPALAAAPTPEPAGDLSAGLEKSRGGFMSRLRGILKSGPADADWDSVEEMLIAGDVGGALAMEVVERARGRKDAPSAEAAVREELAALLIPSDPAWRPAAARAGEPAVLLMVGVNGTGKTTTIGKLAHRYRGEGATVLLAAADTFRAAASDQLRIWADRSGCQFVSHAPGADPAAVIYDSLDAAVSRGIDIVIADTAGRLHTKSNLMDELAKMRRVIDKRLPGATPEVLFVLDATTGQNGLSQAKVFHETVGLTGIVLTKLDSTAKGGIVFAIEAELKVPVRFVGVGERLGDLLPFDPRAFVDALFS
jgi:fused signal recognition particle receptor